MLKAIDPPDGGWGWMVIIGAILQGFFTWGVIGCYSLFYQPLMLQFGIGLGQVSWINGAYEMGRALGYLFSPQFTLRYGHRKSCMFFSTLSALSISLASLTSSDVFVYILVGFIPGFAVGCLSISCYVVVTRYFKKRRMMALSLMQMGSPLGTLVLAPFIQILIQQYGLWGAILITGGLSLNCVVSCALYRPIRLHTDEEENQKSITLSSCAVLSLYKMWIAVFITVTSYGGFRLYVAYLVPLALHRLGTDPVIASLLLSISSAVSIGMRAAFSLIGDHKKVNIICVISLCMLLTSFVCGTVWFINSYSWLVVSCVLFSITSVANHIITVPLTIAAVGEENLQSGMSWIGFISTILLSGILPATGLLIDAFKDERVGFLTAAALFLISFLLFFPLLRKRRNPITKK